MAKRENWSKWSSRKLRLHRVGGFEFIHEHIMDVNKPLPNKENQLESSTGSGQVLRLTAYLPSALTPSSNPPRSTHFTWGRQPVNLEGSDAQNPEAPQWWFFLCAALQPEHHPASPTSLSAHVLQLITDILSGAESWSHHSGCGLLTAGQNAWLSVLDVWSMLDSQQPFHAANTPPAWPQSHQAWQRGMRTCWYHLETKIT